MAELYLATSDKMSWGKSDNLTECVLRTIRHGGDVTKVKVICFQNPNHDVREFLEKVYVDEMGVVNGPKGTRVSHEFEVDCTEITEKLLSITAELQSLEGDAIT